MILSLVPILVMLTYIKHPVIIKNMGRRILWLIMLRWVAGISVVVSVLAGKVYFNIGEVTVPLLLGLLILLYNAAFNLIFKYLHSAPNGSTAGMQKRLILINSQIFLDLIVLATLVYYTGGIVNPLLFFFVFHMVISSILLSRLNAYIWAFFTIILESLIFYLESSHLIPTWKFFPFYPESLINNDDYLLLLLCVFGVTLLVTVYFATTIMRPIRKRQLALTELQNDLQHQRDQLEQKNKELNELDRSKTDFLYRVEHELKAPIGALNSLLSVVARGYSSVSDEKKKDLLNRAQGRCTMMKDLVTDLLSLSRVNERSFQLELETVHFDEILQGVVDDLHMYAAKKEITINYYSPETFPGQQADKHAIIEICRNLVHNAVKYSFQGKVDVTLTLEGEGLKMIVADSGIGISEEDLGNIFNEFYRTSNAKAFEEGTGLGLSLVKRLVEQHGGTIAAESKLNQGTTFTVTLPVNHHPQQG
ncbi:MAG: HAMP domain-containing histidine kinase [bacterium]|nr:HAMP domain-containing histidine kinase [bacterium]